MWKILDENIVEISIYFSLFINPPFKEADSDTPPASEEFHKPKVLAHLRLLSVQYIMMSLIISHNCPLFCFLPLGHNHWISGPSKPRKVDGPHDEKVEHWDDIWARQSQNVKSLRVCKFGSRKPPLPSWAGLGLSSFSLRSTGASGTWSSRPWSFQSTARKERSSGYLEIMKVISCLKAFDGYYIHWEKLNVIKNSKH